MICEKRWSLVLPDLLGQKLPRDCLIKGRLLVLTIFRMEK